MKRDLLELFRKTLVVLLTHLPRLTILLAISLASVAAVMLYNVIGKYPMLALCIFLLFVEYFLKSKIQQSSLIFS